MIESIHFRNFKTLRNTTLPLGWFTLIVGPNGSGKSTALDALEIAGGRETCTFSDVCDVSIQADSDAKAEVDLHWGDPHSGIVTNLLWTPPENFRSTHRQPNDTELARGTVWDALQERLSRIRVYFLNAEMIARTVTLQPNMELQKNGANLAGVLDRLRDQAPERFEALNIELNHWLADFERILFDTPAQGQRSLLLRTLKGGHSIPAKNLSQGTLLALAMLTLAYLPDPPSIVCLEEPDRGIHPRLLRDVRDALYRLSYPDSFGDKRQPVQVVVTTHSPYLIDLFRDEPEEIVIAQKVGSEARFERLVDRPDYNEILQDTPLGEAWYSGILGGVPSER